MKKIWIMLVGITASLGAIAQNSVKGTTLEKITNKNFIFEPQTMMPASGGMRQLNGGYKLQISGDSLISYLPYIGRAYTAQVYGAGGGLDFTSTDFTYKFAPAKKNSYTVNISAKDGTQSSQFTFTIFDDGNAYLQVTSSSRQPVSYNGHIK